MNYREAVKEAGERMLGWGIADGLTDAWYLLEYTMRICRGLRVDHTWFLMHREEPMEGELYRKYQELVERRLRHIPLQYLTGEQEFFGILFYVNENVLIPRQDTELLVERAVKQAVSGMRILDMCTGSGCILLSIQKTVPDICGVGVDISPDALAVARENAKRLQTDTLFLQSDLFKGVKGKYDMIVSNPPYISSAEIETLMPEVKEHEPRLALDGMEDGLYYYRRITRDAPAFLENGGYLMLEIGYDQGDAVSRMLLENGFDEVQVSKDLAGLDRVVTGIWRKEQPHRLTVCAAGQAQNGGKHV